MNIILIKAFIAGALMTATSNVNSVATLATAITPNNQVIEITQPAPDVLDIWLDKLAAKESEGRSHIKILDHNNRYSYGCLQFQMETFRSYTRKYDLLLNTEDSELENMIYDCDFQKTLARKMIEDDRSNWRNWYTSVSVKKLGLPPMPMKDLAEKD